MALYNPFRVEVLLNFDFTHSLTQCLTQDYPTDVFAKAEAKRLRWVKCHQKEIGADKYKGLMDAVQADDAMNAATKVILPPTMALQGGMQNVSKYHRYCQKIQQTRRSPNIHLQPQMA